MVHVDMACAFSKVWSRHPTRPRRFHGLHLLVCDVCLTAQLSRSGFAPARALHILASATFAANNFHYQLLASKNQRAGRTHLRHAAGNRGTYPQSDTKHETNIVLSTRDPSTWNVCDISMQARSCVTRMHGSTLTC